MRGLGVRGLAESQTNKEQPEESGLRGLDGLKQTKITIEASWALGDDMHIAFYQMNKRKRQNSTDP